MAGTAALVVVALSSLGSRATAFGYLILFGIGSILGMMLFSIVLSLPLQLSARRMTRFARLFEAALGLVNIGLGVWIAAEARVF
jgi:hypothetical protein